MKKLFILTLLIPSLFFCSAFVPAEPPGEDRNYEESENIIPEKTFPEGNWLADETEKNKNFIKWIEFNATSNIISAAQKAHKELLEINITDIGTCELLAYVSTKNGNKFRNKSDTKTLNSLMKELKNGNREPIEKYADNKYYKYYVSSYHAVLDGIIHPQTAETIGFHPIAKGHWYNCSDDFGNSRGYGFKRRHLGHDLFGSTGAPIIAIEGGTITELGWNQYGGWRIGIRSFDKKRYYYYAHLRKNKPYPEHFKVGDRIEPGDLIGWLGVTGYSRKPNTNMKTKPHLHFGMQIIFDESQEDGNGEIWIDVCQLCKYLSRHRKSL